MANESEDVVIKQNTCKLCGYKWFARYPNVKPVRCPRCNSTFWDVGRQRKAPKEN